MPGTYVLCVVCYMLCVLAMDVFSVLLCMRSIASPVRIRFSFFLSL